MLLNPIDIIVGGSVAEPLSVTANGTYTAPSGVAYNPVTVNVSGGAAEPERDVNFIDYDGTIVHSYTAAEFAELTALPDNPSHDGLTAQGWNWSLADAQAYVADYGRLWVGQMYITDDGKTRIYIKLEEGRLSPRLGIAVNGSVDVDWGDGSAHDTINGSSASSILYKQHVYSSAGEYTIALTVMDGNLYFIGDNTYSYILSHLNNSLARSVYLNAIKKIELGTGIGGGDSTTSFSFRNCTSLRTITIPQGTQNMNGGFSDCHSLLSLTIPNGVAAFNMANIKTYSLKSISLPNSVTKIFPYSFQYAYSLSAITLPESFIANGNSIFTETGIKYVILAFSPSVTNAAISMFSNCKSLSSIIISKKITEIPSSCFSGAPTIASITIPANITSIQSNAFYNCYGLGSVTFSSAEPPALGNSSVFYQVPTDCVFYVPRGSLEAYTTATNYPSSSTYTYVEYDP